MNTVAQIEMVYEAKDQAAENEPRVGSEEIGLLLNILRGAGWMKRRDIASDFRFKEYFGEVTTDYAERRVRAIAKASGGQVLSWNGSPGYKITLEATPAEVAAGRCLLESGKAQIRHWVEIQRVFHGKVPR